MIFHCYDPDEQVFRLEDKIIGIDWGKNGDMAVQTTFTRNRETGGYDVEFRVLDKEENRK